MGGTGGLCGVFGEYNTTSIKSALYEEAPLMAGDSKAKRLTSIYVALTNDSAAISADVVIYIADVQPLEGGGPPVLADVIAGRGKILAVSDPKAAGGVFGYDPPTEETYTSEEGSIIELGRPILYGLAIYVATASAQGSVEGDVVFVDARWVMEDGLNRIRANDNRKREGSC